MNKLHRLATALALLPFLLMGHAAQAAGPAPADTTASNPLGGKGSPARPASGVRQITWEELVPKDWDPMKDLKGLDLASLDDADPRAAELLMKLQEALNNAPTNPALNGQVVRLPGFVVPLEEDKNGMTEFLLVPYFGACIHTPPPPANQILHVKPRTPAKFRAMDTVWISGRLQTQRNDSMMGTSGYSMAADSVTKYSDK
ncbi:DUF3299 domain-containing protein [Xenophilus arseniciresistens]|uniref:DUF3299 domain-containing protein n=1 Tax=Xenophilus arseniciresistens TaxID=1283306 RepID=A0AAE3N8N1_9BURK|nr:DUF3299 domain-containing protein [Xenophilus arseniciresistens]MDA7417166.1 DUF3299 domain-containing protein [Xenophilus arseniciresistens]